MTLQGERILRAQFGHNGQQRIDLIGVCAAHRVVYPNVRAQSKRGCTVLQHPTRAFIVPNRTRFWRESHVRVRGAAFSVVWVSDFTSLSGTEDVVATQISVALGELFLEVKRRWDFDALELARMDDGFKKIREGIVKDVFAGAELEEDARELDFEGK